VEGMDADKALLLEIDENLARANLSPAEEAAHLHKRKEIFERLHPETKRGAAGKHRPKSKVSQNGTPEKAFIDDAAKKTGRGRSTVARSVSRGQNITDVAALAGTSLDHGVELDAMAKLPPDRQEALRARALAGKKVSAKTELKQEKRATKEKALCT
jgi:ParB family transcriptional regulator, chromosome partitioning protein